MIGVLRRRTMMPPEPNVFGGISSQQCPSRLLLPGSASMLFCGPLSMRMRPAWRWNGSRAMGQLLMSKPRETIWEADEHTLAKHLVLRHYLEAWFPILAKWNRRIVYYDGFAGPGRYAGGEEGSPLIALSVASNHSAKLTAEIVFVFVESRKDRADHLKQEISGLALPDNFKWGVQNQEFDTALSTVLDSLDQSGKRLAPTFAFIDPFGVTGIPMHLIHRLLARPRCEVLITFMNNYLQRFVAEHPERVDELIGVDGAAEQIEAAGGADGRLLVARRLYAQSLGQAARFVRFFEMRNDKDRPIYDLFFAGNDPLGHYRMKEAMWKADGDGRFSFSDGVDLNQATLFEPEPAADLAPAIWREFRGRAVYSDDVLNHVRDATPYLEKHARAALKLLESDGGLNGMTVEVAERKRNGTKRRHGYPKGTQLTFSG